MAIVKNYDLYTLNSYSTMTSFKISVGGECSACHSKRENTDKYNQLFLNLQDESSLKIVIENYFNCECSPCLHCNMNSFCASNELITSPKVLQIYLQRGSLMQKSVEIEVDTSLLFNGERYKVKGALIHQGTLTEGSLSASMHDIEYFRDRL